MSAVFDPKVGTVTSPERGPFIATYSGAEFYVDEINLEDIPLEDIAHALSMNVRFNGHISRPYSVLEHSLNVAELAEIAAINNGKTYQQLDAVYLWGLIHDVSEAFVPDIPRPFKAMLGGFSEFEKRVQAKLRTMMDLPEEPEEVKYVDRHIVRMEAESLYPEPPEWTSGFEDLSELAVFTDVDPKFFGMLDREELVAWWLRDVRNYAKKVAA